MWVAVCLSSAGLADVAVDLEALIRARSAAEQDRALEQELAVDDDTVRALFANRVRPSACMCVSVSVSVSVAPRGWCRVLTAQNTKRLHDSDSESEEEVDLSAASRNKAAKAAPPRSEPAVPARKVGALVKPKPPAASPTAAPKPSLIQPKAATPTTSANTAAPQKAASQANPAASVLTGIGAYSDSD
jgi:hypothetical protein